MPTIQEIQKRSIGYFDYNDLATATVPISVAGGGGYVDLTNDGNGPFTNNVNKPTSMTTIYDTVGNTFDWSELSLGDEVTIRLDINITTLSVNTEFDIRLLLADGGASYGIQWVNFTNLKSSGVYKFVELNKIYMGDANTLDNGAKFQIQSDNTCEVEVLGWFVSVHRR